MYESLKAYINKLRAGACGTRITHAHIVEAHWSRGNWFSSIYKQHIPGLYYTQVNVVIIKSWS